MKQILLLISIVLLFFTSNANAQLKPAQSQYLVEKGVLINPSFEQGYKGWVITGCTKSLVTETPYLDKSLKLTCTNETFSIKQVSASLIDFKNQQGAFDLQIKTTASGVNVSSITNGARDNAYSILDSTTFKRFKEIGFIVGDTDNGIEVYSDTNFTGEIIVDNFKLGLGNLTQDIGAAHFVGSLNQSNIVNCQWSLTSTVFASFPVDIDCSAYSITGDVSKPSTQIPAVKILNARTDGYYRVELNGWIYGSGANDTTIRLFSGGISGGVVGNNSGAVDDMVNNTSYQFRYVTSGDKTIELQASSSSGTVSVYANSDKRALEFNVYFFPDSKNTIAVQKSQSPNYAGFLSFSFMDGDLQGHLPADGRCVAKNLYPDYDKRVANLYGDCDAGTGANTGYNLPDMRGYFPRMVDTTSEGTAGVNPDNTLIGGKQADQNVSHNHAINGQLNTAVTDLAGGSGANYGILFNGALLASQTQFSGGNEARPSAISLMAYVRMADNNLVVGSFEQIRSGDLITVKGSGNSGQTITANVTPVTFNITSVNTRSVWDGSTLTADSKGRYSLDGSIYITANAALGWYFFVDRGFGYVQEELINKVTNQSQSIIAIHGTLDLDIGDKVQIREATSGATLLNNVAFHFLNITQQATKESIVANLMQGQTTKCQTKYLSANISAVGILADLTFSNLTIGKKYSLFFQAVTNSNWFGSAHNNSIFSGAYLMRTATNNAGLSTSGSRVFTAIDSSVIIYSGATTTIYGNGIEDTSYAQLCELPDTVISTTEFN